MARNRSGLKRLHQSLKRRARNRSVKSVTRTLLTKALNSISADADAAEDAVRAAVSGLDRAAQKGVIHHNVASRSKARLLKRFNLAVARQVAAAAAATPADVPAPEEAPAPASRRTRARKAPAAEAPTEAAEAPAAEEKPARRNRSRRTTS